MKLSASFLAGAGAVAAGYLSHRSGLDLWVASQVYDHFGGFPRNAYFLKKIMHESMRSLVTAALSALALLMIWDLARPRAWLTQWRRPLRVFILCALAFIGGVAALKSLTTFSCPWDLTAFGGRRALADYTELFSTGRLGKGHCFPAGHSTSGYAWLCLAYVLGTSPEKFRRLFFALLPFGVALSTAQILRGAHFLSHELTTFGIALMLFSTLPRLFPITPAMERRNAD